MYCCPNCNQTYQIMSGWNPPPSPFERSGQIVCHPVQKKCFLVSLLCECGIKLAQQVFSAPIRLGFWRMIIQQSSTIEVENISQIKDIVINVLEEGLGELLSEIDEEIAQNRTQLVSMKRVTRKFQQKGGIQLHYFSKHY